MFPAQVDENKTFNGISGAYVFYKQSDLDISMLISNKIKLGHKL